MTSACGPPWRQFLQSERAAMVHRRNLLIINLRLIPDVRTAISAQIRDCIMVLKDVVHVMYSGCNVTYYDYDWLD
jgi:hypothetical protein